MQLIVLLFSIFELFLFSNGHYEFCVRVSYLISSGYQIFQYLSLPFLAGFFNSPKKMPHVQVAF